ncbi:lasso peptide biosynthesis PqqD family chaperone [Streptomyces sp. NPDC020800]|uniref:lasso peptide biosynthesis PqqD family chaperone n=1 Tax=Streptomyces sp. NPDC020800 TaxID=3365092 RepID=UPI00379C0539
MTFALSPHVHAATTGDGMVLLDERANRYWLLNANGVLVLRALLGGASAEQAARQLADAEPVAPDQATRDVTALITALSAARLVAS